MKNERGTCILYPINQLIIGPARNVIWSEYDTFSQLQKSKCKTVLVVNIWASKNLFALLYQRRPSSQQIIGFDLENTKSYATNSILCTSSVLNNLTVRL